MADRRTSRHVKGRKRAMRKRKGGGAPAPKSLPENGEVRLNRYLARAGVASRRASDELIAEGLVRVNGETVTEMGTKVLPTDRVEVDGQPVTPAGLVYVLLNKPKDAITTASDEKGRRTVLDLVDVQGAEGEALFPVGRLDRDTTGALLLTTDGDLAHRLMHPRYGASKLYVIQTAKAVTPEQIDALREGVDLDDGPATADQVGYVDSKDKTRIAMALHEGRNRQVRRMLEALGHEVVALDRLGYAGLDLTNLRRGRWRRLEPHEVNALRRSVKLKPIVF